MQQEQVNDHSGNHVIVFVYGYFTNISLLIGFPRLFEILEKREIYFGSMNPGNSLEFSVKTLNPHEICERHEK